MELISGLLGVVIGTIITYYFSTRLLRKQLEAQQAYDFVSKNYLPMLSALTEYKYSLGMWGKLGARNKGINIGDIDEYLKLLTDEEALKMCSENFARLREAINRLVTSGISLLINNIDEKLGAYISVLSYHMNRLHRCSDKRL